MWVEVAGGFFLFFLRVFCYRFAFISLETEEIEQQSQK